MSGEVPEFDQFVEYVDAGGVHAVALAQHSLGTPQTLATVQDGYAHAAQLGRPVALDSAALADVQTAVADAYHADVITHEVVGSDPGVICARLAWVQNHPIWFVGAQVVPPGIWRYSDNNLYRCVQGHTTQNDWTPPVVPALWTKVYEPGAVPAWVQPMGAQDAWPFGAHVLSGGQEWISDIANNVWQPGVYGWSLANPVPPTNNWAVGVAYVGDNTAGAGNGNVVLYVPNNHRYRCLQSHTSQAGWTPPVVPALWLDLGLA